jgi:hypothetical protein
MSKYIQYIPFELLEDIRRGECVPVIGAGFSMNAILPQGCRMPLWNDLGIEIAGKMNITYSGDAKRMLSQYCHTCSKFEMIRSLRDSLHIRTARPGSAHLEFAKLPFVQVLTTNLDFLLERAYDNCGRPYLPIVDEDLLPFRPVDNEVRLIKMHGDLHHPNSLVITEEDYSKFQIRRERIFQEIIHLMVNHSLLFIGYSIDDPDFQQIWGIVDEQFKSMRRPAYAILLGASETKINEYQRRGVTKVISFPASQDEYGIVLTKVFQEINLSVSNFPTGDKL